MQCPSVAPCDLFLIILRKSGGKGKVNANASPGLGRHALGERLRGLGDGHVRLEILETFSLDDGGRSVLQLETAAPGRMPVCDNAPSAALEDERP